MRTATNSEVDPITVSYCIRPSHWPENDHVEDDDACILAEHTIEPGASLTYDDAAPNSSVIETIIGVS
jgi:hypothetical protein